MITSLQKKLVFFQVWDDMIIDSALKTFYGKDLEIMIQAIQGNITVCIYLGIQLAYKDYCL